MAKRVSPEEKTWNPVEDQLAQETLRPSPLPRPTRLRPRPRLSPLPQPRTEWSRLRDHREPAQVEPKAEEQAPKKVEAEPVEKLSREKRSAPHRERGGHA